MKTTPQPATAYVHLIIAAATAALVSVGLSAAPRGLASVLRFEIEDGFDVQNDGLGEYVDFRLLANPADTLDANYCMETSAATSLTFLFFNRDEDALGGAGSVSCDVGPYARRQFVLHINSAAACAELLSNNYGESDGGTGCLLSGHRNPRMRLDKLFANRARTTPVDFLIGRNPDNPLDTPTYELQSTGEASISVSGTARTITYGLSSAQAFRLVKFGGTAVTKGKGGTSTPAWALPFVMTLRMTFAVQGVTE